MRLQIQHRTIYRYSAPPAYSIQQLRLTPRAEPSQTIVGWDIQTPGKLHAFTDAYGNCCHTLTLIGAHQELSILAQGLVELSCPPQGRIPDTLSLSPYIFTNATRLTGAGTLIAAFAHRHLPRTAAASTAELLNLASQIRAAIAYQSGATIVSTSASDALALGRGVCQDHAHVFLACCHARAIPARYVSGYIDPESSGHAASHAWVDAWVQDHDYHGWVSIDVTHARLMNASYCRLALGRDYDSAAPVRGIRQGGGDESLEVAVHVTPQ